MDYTLEEPSKEDADKITAELKEVLEKYDCEMQVTSTINILKRTYPDVVESPYNGTDNKEESEEDSNGDAEEGSISDSTE